MSFFFNTSNINAYFENVNKRELQTLTMLNQMRVEVPLQQNYGYLPVAPSPFLPRFTNSSTMIKNKERYKNIVKVLSEKHDIINNIQSSTFIENNDVARNEITFVSVPKIRSDIECANMAVHNYGSSNYYIKNAISKLNIIVDNSSDNSMRNYYVKYEMQLRCSDVSLTKQHVNIKSYAKYKLGIAPQLIRFDEKYLFIRYYNNIARQKFTLQTIQNVQKANVVNDREYNNNSTSQRYQTVALKYKVMQASLQQFQNLETKSVDCITESALRTFDSYIIPYGISIYNANRFREFNHINHFSTFITSTTLASMQQRSDIYNDQFDNVIFKFTTKAAGDILSNGNNSSNRCAFTGALLHSRFFGSNSIFDTKQKINKISCKYFDEMATISYFNAMMFPIQESVGCNNDVPKLRHCKSNFLPPMYHNYIKNEINIPLKPGKVKRVYEYDILFYGKQYDMLNSDATETSMKPSDNINFIKIFVHSRPKSGGSSTKRKVINIKDDIADGIAENRKKAKSKSEQHILNDDETNVKLPQKRPFDMKGSKMLVIKKRNKHNRDNDNAKSGDLNINPNNKKGSLNQGASTISNANAFHTLLSTNIKSFNRAYKLIHAAKTNTLNHEKSNRHRIAFVNPEHFMYWGLDVLRYLEKELNCIIHERTTNTLLSIESIVLNTFGVVVILQTITFEAKHIFHDIIMLFSKYKHVDVYLNADNLKYDNVNNNNFHYQHTMELQRLIHSLSVVNNIRIFYYTSVDMLCQMICFISDDKNAQILYGDGTVEYDTNVETTQEIFLTRFPCFNVCTAFQLLQRYTSLKQFINACKNIDLWANVKGENETPTIDVRARSHTNQRRGPLLQTKSKLSNYFISQKHESYWFDLLCMKFP